MVTVHILDAQHVLDLPVTAISFLQDIQRRVMRDDCFMRHSSVYIYLLEGGGCLQLPGETQMIEEFLKEFAGLVLDHTKDLAESVVAEMDLDEVYIIGHISEVTTSTSPRSRRLCSSIGVWISWIWFCFIISTFSLSVPFLFPFFAGLLP